MASRDTVDAYYASIRARDADAYAALFAQDAVFRLPDGRDVVGRQAIRAMMEHVLATAPPAPEPTFRIDGEGAVAVEASVALADGGSRSMCSVFELDGDGLIRRLAAYARAG